MKKKFLNKDSVCKVTFSLPKEAADSAKSVAVVGDFNDWQPTPLKKSKNGSFELEFDLQTGQDYEFRYVIDENKWENDWNADDYVASPYTGIENSVVKVPTMKILVPGKKAATASTKKTAPKKASKKTAAPKKATAKVTAKKAAKTSTKKTEKATKVSTKKTAAKKSAKASTKKTAKDDLRKIEGIGPKIAEHLAKAGIVTFADLSKAKVKELQAVLDGAGPRYKIHKPNTWPKQAKLAAKGQWDKLKELQDALDGGKVVK